jgi:hypothetical protein
VADAANVRVNSKTNANNVEILRYAHDVNGRLTTRWSKAKSTSESKGSDLEI